MSPASDWPCEVFVHPRSIFNLPGRAAIDYRVGDYASFRHARDGEDPVLPALGGESANRGRLRESTHSLASDTATGLSSTEDGHTPSR